MTFIAYIYIRLYIQNRFNNDLNLEQNQVYKLLTSPIDQLMLLGVLSSYLSFDVSQTLFNDDEKFEYLIPKFKLSKFGESE